MKLVLSFNGSRGDVQPGIALAVALTERGHDVVMAVPPNLVDFASTAGVDARPCGPSTDDILESELVARDLKSSNPLRRLRAISELTVRGGRLMQDVLFDLTENADVIVGSSVGQERALNVAEARGIAYVPVHYCPVRRNGSVSLLPLARDLPSGLTRASWVVVEQVLWQATRRVENTLRADLGLKPTRSSAASRIARRGTPEIQAYDDALFPSLASEWGPARPLVGFLELAPTTRRLTDPPGADPQLTRWLDAGPPPVYVGFGSMTVPDPQRVGAAVVAAAEATGQRILVASGWSGFMTDRPDVHPSVFVTPSVDHARVLPRCAAAVHHGGAGSTAAGLRAGLPTLVCWFGADQAMWGRQMVRTGVGATLPVRSVTESTFAAGVARILTTQRRSAAADLGSRLTPAADAVAAAVRVIESAA